MKVTLWKRITTPTVKSRLKNLDSGGGSFPSFFYENLTLDETLEKLREWLPEPDLQRFNWWQERPLGRDERVAKIRFDGNQVDYQEGVVGLTVTEVIYLTVYQTSEGRFAIQHQVID